MSSDVAFKTALAILIIVDISGNCLVCWVVKRNRDMRTPFNWLLVNLAIADITFAVFQVPNRILTFTHPDGTIGSALCKALTAGNVAWVGAAAGTITLVVIAFERYYTVRCPLSGKGKLTKNTLKVIIPACWIFAVAANLPTFLVTKFDEKTRNCRLNLPKDWMNAANNISWLVLLACIPFALMIGLYSRVVYELWFKPRDDLEVVCRHKGILRVRKRVTLSVITVSVIFGVCWITGLLIYVLIHYNILVFGSASNVVSDIMFMVNSSANPFVYALLNERFRQKIKAMLHCTCKSKRYSPATHEPATIIHQKNQLNTK